MDRKQVFHLCHSFDDNICNQSALQLQSAIEQSTFRSLHLQSRISRPAGRAVNRAGLLRNVARLPRYAIFAQCHRMSASILFPLVYLFEPITYSFDCWPYHYDEWENFFRRFRMRLAFLTARQSAQEMQKRLPHIKFVWMPECCEPDVYQYQQPLSERTIDVLELGRQYAKIHDQITPPLEQQKLKHLYKKKKSDLLFPRNDDLITAYGQTRVSVCFPASITDPDWAGDVETVTLRYFESMASKTLIWGHAPAELVEMMGFNPVIEADAIDPAGQLLAIIAKIGEYQQWVDRVYDRFLAVGTCKVRMNQMKAVMEENGYQV